MPSWKPRTGPISLPYKGADGRWYVAVDQPGGGGETRRYLSARTRRGLAVQLDKWRRSGQIPQPSPPRLAASRKDRSRTVKVSTALLCAGGLLGAGLLVDHSGALLSHHARRPRRSTGPSRGAQANALDTPQITHFLATRTSHVTMALYDFDNGETSVYSPGVTEQTGSIEKVAILATLLQQHQVSNTPLSATTVALATSMIEHSNDVAATTLWGQVGGAPAVARYDTAVGLTDTTIGTKGFWGETTTTAADQVRMVRSIVSPSSPLDAQSQGFELNLMENLEADQRWGISAGVPSGVTVALKNGWVPLTNYYNWQVNSVGWVAGDGRNYVLAVLSSGDGSEQYGIDTIQGVASLVWNELTPPPSPVP